MVRILPSQAITPPMPPGGFDDKRAEQWLGNFVRSLVEDRRRVVDRIERVVLYGATSDRPDVRGAGDFYYDTDKEGFYLDDGAWTLIGGSALTGGYINVMEYGVVGDGIVDDSENVQSAVDAFEDAGDNSVLLFPSNKTYLLDSTISFTIPNNSVVKAFGASFLSTKNQVMFEINDGADFDNHSTTLRRNVAWYGGFFDNTHVTKDASVAIQAHIFRNLLFSRVRFRKWYRGIEFAALDTYKFEHCYFYDCEEALIHPGSLVQDNSSVPIEVNLENCHFAQASNAQWCFKMEERFSNVNICNSSFNGIGGKIYVSHEEAIQARGLMIQGCHFEQSDGTQYDIHLNDGTGNGGIYGVKICGCDFSSGDIGWKGLKAERTFGLDIDACVFNDGSGGATEEGIRLDQNCKDVRIGQAVKFLNVANPIILESGFDRSRLTIEPEIRAILGELTAYNGDSFTTGSETIDMSSALGANYPGVGMPKGYHVVLQARDSGSAAAGLGAALVRVKKSSGVNDGTGILLSLTGAINDEKRGAAGFLPCDSDGDIYIRYLATGAGTLDIWLTVTGIVM